MQPHTEAAPPDHFPTETTGLPACRRSEIVDLSDGATFELEIAAVAKQLGDARVRMHAYNGSIPGPTLGGAPGLGGGGQRRQPWGPGGDGPLARAAVEEPLRRHPRDADADPDRPERSLTRRLSGPGRVLVSPARAPFPGPGVPCNPPHTREASAEERALKETVLGVPRRSRVLAAGTSRD